MVQPTSESVRSNLSNTKRDHLLFEDITAGDAPNAEKRAFLNTIISINLLIRSTGSMTRLQYTHQQLREQITLVRGVISSRMKMKWPRLGQSTEKENFSSGWRPLITKVDGDRPITTALLANTIAPLFGIR